MVGSAHTTTYSNSNHSLRMVASMIPSSWQIPAFNCVELAPKQAKYAL
jgi:hypothetical protein